MELFEVPNRCYVKMLEDTVAVAPWSPRIEKGDVLFFYYVDGMYSYCKNQDGSIVHPIAWSEVEIVDESGNVYVK